MSKHPTPLLRTRAVSHEGLTRAVVEQRPPLADLVVALAGVLELARAESGPAGGAGEELFEAAVAIARRWAAGDEDPNYADETRRQLLNATASRNEDIRIAAAALLTLLLAEDSNSAMAAIDTCLWRSAGAIHWSLEARGAKGDPWPEAQRMVRERFLSPARGTPPTKTNPCLPSEVARSYGMSRKDRTPDRRPNPIPMRELLVTKRNGLGWVTQLPPSATREQRKFLLEYGPFIRHIRAGGRMKYNPEGLMKLSDEFVRTNRETALERWNQVNFDHQIDPRVRQFLLDWQHRFPGVAHPSLGGVGNLAVVESPKGVPVRISACEGAETVERMDGEWL